MLICTDKNGNFPWDEKCESYWPQLCPPPFVAMAQEQLTGDDSLLCRLEEYSFKRITYKEEVFEEEGEDSIEDPEDLDPAYTNFLESPLAEIAYIFHSFAFLGDGEVTEAEGRENMKNSLEIAF